MPSLPDAVVTNEAQLNDDMTALAGLAPDSGSFTITLGQDISLGEPLLAVNLAAGVTLDLEGAGFSLDGGGQQRGLFVYKGAVAVDALTIANTAATGGTGGAGQYGAGGGAGLGGGLFVAAGGTVSLSYVTFSHDAAKGGAGGASSGYGRGGGGGLGGAGGAGSNAVLVSQNIGASPGGADGGGGGGGIISGGGGGIGASASGSEAGSATATAGIVPEGSAGGYDDFFPPGNGGQGGSDANGGSGGGIGAYRGGYGIGAGDGGFGGGGGAGGGHTSTGSGTYPIGGYGGGGGFGGGGGGGGASAGGGGFGGGGGASSPAYGGGGTSFGGGVGGAITGGAGGGGGLGAGADIFVQGGGQLSIGAGVLGLGTIAGGAGASGGETGGAYGSGIFIEGGTTPQPYRTFVVPDEGQVITFAPALGQTLTVAGNIADVAGSPHPDTIPEFATLMNEERATIDASGGGTVRLAASNSFSGGIVLSDGTLALAALGAAGSGAIVFANGHGAAVLRVEAAAVTAGSLGNTLDNFGFGDTLDLPGLTYVVGQTGAVRSDNMLVVTSEADSVTFTLGGTEAATYTAMQDASGGTLIVNDAVACFAAGTRIATARGEAAMEDLRVGDRVPTLHSAALAAIVWLGHRDVDCTRHPRPHDVWPVRIQAGAFGAGQPLRDLYLSPDHAVFVRGALIPIRYLVNGATIAQIPMDSVVYWHVELERHDVLLAEGLACESYLDTGNRAAFTNDGPSVNMHPDFALNIWAAKSCSPLVRDGAQLEAARSFLLERAGLLGHSTTGEPAIEVAANGHVIEREVIGAVHRFHLPAAAADLRLVSRSVTPAHIHAESTDHRRLGVAVSRIWIDQLEVALDGPRLTTGWHDLEQDWRWTDGDAGLALSGARLLEIEVAMTERYWVERGDGHTTPARSSESGKFVALQM